MRPLSQLSRLVVLSVLLSGGAVLAGRPVNEFQPPPEMTKEEREANKVRELGGNINSYNRDVQIHETPVPWAALGLAALILLGAAPFAWRAYRSTSKEIADANTFGNSGAHQAEDES
ncbi:hypothetical protein POL68_04080 [Stigmatella sp. ncwal1]|uniref:Secreted protein n=1 Tax=Stigmatella ashevillensis TaxID=2995309 RepID=A0ABT5D1V8_9BACT|nr:hypothetical protein [Stigmatella ashevillena]MDC0707639.1 hypothetical protein [Stigmatella ashevillena]